MSKFEKSIILMGIDWSKAAKMSAVEDIKKRHPKTVEIIKHLDRLYRKE